MRNRRFAACLSVLLTWLIFAPTALAMTEERAIERGTRTVVLMGGWMGDDLGRHEDEQGTAKRDLGYDIVETRLK